MENISEFTFYDGTLSNLLGLVFVVGYVTTRKSVLIVIGELGNKVH